MFCGLAAEARSCTCMKAYLVNASDPVLIVWIEFGIQEPDPARAAHIIVQRMKSDAKGVLLHKCEPLYLHCGNVFEAVMPKPCRLMALEHVVTRIRQQVLGDRCGCLALDAASSTASPWFRGCFIRQLVAPASVGRCICNRNSRLASYACVAVLCRHRSRICI